MLDFLHQYGYWGLFFASFLSATVIPLSSEGVVSLLLYSGFSLWPVVVVASLGNWLGGMSCYALGYWGKSSNIERWLRIKQERIDKYQNKINRWGSILACLCWMPLIGDVLAVGLGFFRCNLFFTSIFMFLGKAARYVVWALLSSYVLL